MWEHTLLVRRGCFGMGKVVVERERPHSFYLWSWQGEDVSMWIFKEGKGRG